MRLLGMQNYVVHALCLGCTFTQMQNTYYSTILDMHRLVASSMRMPPALKLCAPALLHELDHDTADGTVVAEVCAAVLAFAGMQGKYEWE